jgi:hypothetical protein
LHFSWRLDICTSFYHCWHCLNNGEHAAGKHRWPVSTSATMGS